MFLILISEATDTQFLKPSCEHAKPIECVLQRVSGGPVGMELDYQLFLSSKVACSLSCGVSLQLWVMSALASFFSVFDSWGTLEL